MTPNPLSSYIQSLNQRTYQSLAEVSARSWGCWLAGSTSPCVNDMQSSLRGRGREKEGHLHKTCKNAQKSLLLLHHARIDMQGAPAPYSRDAESLDPLEKVFLAPLWLKLEQEKQEGNRELTPVECWKIRDTACPSQTLEKCVYRSPLPCGTRTPLFRVGEMCPHWRLETATGPRFNRGLTLVLRLVLGLRWYSKSKKAPSPQ